MGIGEVCGGGVEGEVGIGSGEQTDLSCRSREARVLPTLGCPGEST